jgi:hypothetical protein
MNDYDYLAIDAMTKKAKLTTNFKDALSEAFADLRGFRTEYLNATDDVLAAQKRYNDAKAEALAAGVVGNNAEIRAANLDLTIRSWHDQLVDKKKDQGRAELNLQIASDYVREMQMLLDAVKSGMVDANVVADGITVF